MKLNRKQVILPLAVLALSIAVGECMSSMSAHRVSVRPITTTEPSQATKEVAPPTTNHPVADVDSLHLVGSPIVVSTWDSDNGYWFHILATEVTNSSANSITIGNDGDTTTMPELSCPGGAYALKPVNPDNLSDHSRQVKMVLNAAGLDVEDAVAFFDNGGVAIDAHRQAQETTWLYLGSNQLDADDFMGCSGSREVTIGSNKASVSPSNHRLVFIEGEEVLNP